MSFKSRFAIPAVAAISFCLICRTVPAAADILHVPGDYPTIQEAIDAAVDGDEVEVHPGTYNEAIDFLGKAIRVYSSDGPDVTIIDAGGFGGFGTVVTCDSAEGPDSVLEGFTITGGSAAKGGAMRNIASSPTVLNCTFAENTATIHGGGMYNLDNASPTVINCTFTLNTAITAGGGMYNFNGSSPVVIDCTFSENSTTFIGGGMVNGEGSSPTIINCLITRNTADEIGGGGLVIGIGGTLLLIDCIISDNTARLGYGGGIICGSTSILVVTNCQITDNVAGMRGGGIYCGAVTATISKSTILGNSAIDGGGMFNSPDSSPTISNCTFSGNVATEGNGGAMSNLASTPTVTNCIFSRNRSTEGNGGAMYNDASSPMVSNSTFNENSAGGDGGGIYSRTVGSHPRFDNCILWADSGGEIIDANGAMTTVSYTDVHGGWPGTGNIDADPLFVDPENGDFHLSSGSPSIDAGNNWGVPIDENDYDEDGVLCELFPVDLDGNPRFNADEADFDPGCGVPVVVDMGAYEYQFDPADQVTFADLNGDNAVGAADLLGLLVSWGPCGKGCCLADLDIDGSVGASDLLALLANWGPCP